MLVALPESLGLSQTEIEVVGGSLLGGSLARLEEPEKSNIVPQPGVGLLFFPSLGDHPDSG